MRAALVALGVVLLLGATVGRPLVWSGGVVVDPARITCHEPLTVPGDGESGSCYPLEGLELYITHHSAEMSDATTYTDQSGNGHDVTASMAGGVNADYYHFDNSCSGVGTYRTECLGCGATSTDSAWSVVVYGYLDNAGTGTQTLFEGTDGDGSNQWVRIQQTFGPVWSISTGTTGTDDGSTAAAAGWHCYVMTHDGSGVYTLYVDGTLEATDTDAVDPIGLADDLTWGESTNDAWCGRGGQTWIYSRVLSDAERTSICTCGA